MISASVVLDQVIEISEKNSIEVRKRFSLKSVFADWSTFLVIAEISE